MAAWFTIGVALFAAIGTFLFVSYHIYLDDSFMRREPLLSDLT